ncbi:MAG: hypothetical protein ACXAC5_03780 [Promethearchaeota archaeon]
MPDELRGRHCAICGKAGGLALTLPLKWLREMGAKISNGDYAHNTCLSRLRSKLTRMR